MIGSMVRLALSPPPGLLFGLLPSKLMRSSATCSAMPTSTAVMTTAYRNVMILPDLNGKKKLLEGNDIPGLTLVKKRHYLLVKN